MVLDAAERKRVRKWGIPPHDGKPGAYPIEDPNHARDALSRVSANGTPVQKAQVRREVRKDYPGIKQSMSRPTQ